MNVRKAKDGELFLTENGNFILDCAIGEIPEPERLEALLTSIPGVVETGLFIGICGDRSHGHAQGRDRVQARMTAFDYDLFVIGAGSGGVRAARVAAKHGAKVAVAEEYRVGGTCVIRGCVPKKLLVYASKFAEEFEDAIGFGWTSEKVTFDWATLIENKDKEIDRLNKAYIRNLEGAGAELIMERAEIRGPQHGPPRIGQEDNRQIYSDRHRRRPLHPAPSAGP